MLPSLLPAPAPCVSPDVGTAREESAVGGATPPVNLSSASYLGLQHASAELRPWTQLTLGGPAALVAYPGEGAMGETLAALQGCERVVVGPSTFHLFWDLFGLFSTEGVAD